MMIRDKKIGKSIYRIIKIGGRFSIMETYRDKQATAPTTYRTMDEAIQTLATFDRERIIVGDI